MPTYLILRKTGPGDLDWKPTGVIPGYAAEEVDQAIADAADGPGVYLALSVATKTERSVVCVNTVQAVEGGTALPE